MRVASYLVSLACPPKPTRVAHIRPLLANVGKNGALLLFPAIPSSPGHDLTNAPASGLPSSIRCVWIPPYKPTSGDLCAQRGKDRRVCSLRFVRIRNGGIAGFDGRPDLIPAVNLLMQ